MVGLGRTGAPVVAVALAVAFAAGVVVGLGRTGAPVVAVALAVAFAAGVVVGSGRAGVARTQASSSGAVSAIPPRPAMAFRNTRRFILLLPNLHLRILSELSENLFCSYNTTADLRNKRILPHPVICFIPKSVVVSHGDHFPRELLTNKLTQKDAAMPH